MRYERRAKDEIRLATLRERLEDRPKNKNVTVKLGTMHRTAVVVAAVFYCGGPDGCEYSCFPKGTWSQDHKYCCILQQCVMKIFMYMKKKKKRTSCGARSSHVSTRIRRKPLCSLLRESSCSTGRYHASARTALNACTGSQSTRPSRCNNYQHV